MLPRLAPPQNCNGADGCLCSNETAVSIVECEQCMFTNLIARNKKPDDARAGQTSAIAGEFACCLPLALLCSFFPSTLRTLAPSSYLQPACSNHH